MTDANERRDSRRDRLGHENETEQSCDRPAAGVYGEATDTGSNTVHAVYGKTNASSFGSGVYAEAPDGGGPALLAKANNGQALTTNGDASIGGSLDANEVSVTSLGASVTMSSDQDVSSETNEKVEFDQESVDDNG